MFFSTLIFQKRPSMRYGGSWAHSLSTVSRHSSHHRRSQLGVADVEQLEVASQATGPDAEDEAAAAELIEHRHVGGDGRGMHLRHIDDVRAELDALRPVDERGQEDQRRRDALAPRAEVLADEDFGEAEPISQEDGLLVFVEDHRIVPGGVVERHRDHAKVDHGPYNNPNPTSNPRRALMAETETYRKGRELRRQLLGDAFVERANKAAYADPIMKKFIDVATETVFGSLWTRPGLDLKTRTLICVVSDAATARTPELCIHLRMARRQGWTEGELVEGHLHLRGYVRWALISAALPPA